MGGRYHAFIDDEKEEEGCNTPKIPLNFYNNFIIYSGYELSQT